MGLSRFPDLVESDDRDCQTALVWGLFYLPVSEGV